jgi:hypothetical protein
MPLLAIDCCTDVVNRVRVNAASTSGSRQKSEPTINPDGRSGREHVARTHGSQMES